MKPPGLGWRSTETAIAARPLSCWPSGDWLTEVRGIWPELSAIEPWSRASGDRCQIRRYLKRQVADVDAFRRDEGLFLGDIDYRVVPGLSNEARSRLEAARPRTVGQAGRLDGLTPAALGILAAYLRREARRKGLSSATA
jgi:tRNA uridine 5-carboxymethylaminomethyl modification enzyme